MNNLITYEDAVVLFRHGISVIMCKKDKTPEFWQNFSPSCKEGWVYKKKFETIDLQVRSAIPVSIQDHDEFYTVQTIVQKHKATSSGIAPCEELIRNHYIASFRTHEEALEVSYGLMDAYGGIK